MSNAPYQYQVKESSISAYALTSTVTDTSQTDITAYTFTNKHPVTEQELKVEKQWDDVGYKDTVRPTDLTKVTVELWCRYPDASGNVVDHKVSEDTDANRGIQTHIEKVKPSGETYKYAPSLHDFTAVDDDANTTDINEGEYYSTYTFKYLPVFINADGTNVSAGTQYWQAVTYYVKEVKGSDIQVTYDESCKDIHFIVDGMFLNDIK